MVELWYKRHNKDSLKAVSNSLQIWMTKSCSESRSRLFQLSPMSEGIWSLLGSSPPQATRLVTYLSEGKIVDEADLERSVDLIIEQEEIIGLIEKIRNDLRGRGLK